MDIEHNNIDNIDKEEIKTKFSVDQVISKCFASVAPLIAKAISTPKINFYNFFFWQTYLEL